MGKRDLDLNDWGIDNWQDGYWYRDWVPRYDMG